MTGVRPAELIGRKRDGGELTESELAALVGGYLDGGVGEGQMGAFLMAGVLNGFTEAEALALTRVLAESGEQLDLSAVPGATVDKHSTGGVADGTTLIVAPLLAACGVSVVKLSGRGLGHTGGTLDKLESIPGLRTGLEADEMRAIAADVGCVVAAQTDRIVPADRALYALRDVTGTVASTALIASSVMSKKLASGAQHIVLDVKAGDGAFMPDADSAEELASLCVRIGQEAGRGCVALVTAMDQPLGRAVGNALEVAEAVELLSRPPEGRLAEVSLALAAEGLAAARGADPEAVRDELLVAWTQGAALERLRAMITAQGGDGAVCDDPRGVLPASPVIREVPAPAAGTVTRVACKAMGELAATLGAGRARKGDDVDPAVGIEVDVSVGDHVDAGQPLAIVHARTEDAAASAVDRIDELIEVGDQVPAAPTILRRVAQ